jgi:glycosyltransferase involved in cell wall biosynthesis
LNVLLITPTYYPAVYFGGPIFATMNLMDELAARFNCGVRVLTTDAAGPSLAERINFDSIPATYKGGYDVHFSRRIGGVSIAPGLLSSALFNLGWADIVYLNGTYSFPTLPILGLCKVFAKPLVWAPCGAHLSAATWQGGGRRRAKSIWDRLCRGLSPLQCLVHVASLEEESAVRERLPGIPTEVIPPGVHCPDTFFFRERSAADELHLLYLGRIDPIKGLENLFRALRLLISPKVHLKLYGSGEVAYVQRLRDLARELAISDRVELKGQLSPGDRRLAFAQSDICVLPSFSENFGLVVAEALAHGMPVLASRGTPWKRIEPIGCGRCVANDPESLAAAISWFKHQDLPAMGLAGRKWMQEEYDWKIIGQRVLGSFEQLTLTGGRARRSKT